MKCTVAIIDDDDVCLYLHQKVIEALWDRPAIQMFNSAMEALAVLRRREQTIPLLLFLDINMPLVSGWDVLEIIQQENFGREIFVIMISSSVDPADQKRALQFSKVIEFVEKPLNELHLNGLQSKVLFKING